MNPEPLYIVESTGFPYYQRVLVPTPRHWSNKIYPSHKASHWIPTCTELMMAEIKSEMWK